MLPLKPNRSIIPAVATAVLVTVFLWSPLLSAREISLDAAIDMAVNHTARGGMIRGNLEVAEQYYSARRINMYVPEISINGSLPSYSLDESYRAINNVDKAFYKSRSLDFSSFIELKQSLFTGGSLTATANLSNEDDRRPDNTFALSDGIFLDETTRQGDFRFNLEQPLFRPSSVRNELNNRKDDLEIAKVTRVQEEATLKKEVTEAYLSVLDLSIQENLTSDRLEKNSLKQNIDSLKLEDGVISEEDYLISTSERLDAELEHFSVVTQLGEQKRELATLLDMDVNDELKLDIPEIADHIEPNERARLEAAWDRTAPIVKAEHVYQKAEREANYAASGHGLTGDLRASYSFGRQKIETERSYVRDTSGNIIESVTTESLSPSSTGWTVGLEFRFPIWDGGAGSAAVKAARFESEKARYEFTRAKRSARATIINLLNELDVSYQRLGIIGKQIDLASNRFDIAKDREADGQISRLTLLDSRIFYLETRQKYLEELKKYLLNRIELDSQFTGT